MKEKRYVVFCDLDGTLLNENGKVTDFTKEAFKRFKAAGNEIVFTTARSRRLQGIGGALREISDDFILHNGGELIRQGECIAKHYFSLAQAREIGLRMTKAGVCAAVILEDAYYANYDAPKVWGEIRGFVRTDFLDLPQAVPKFALYFPSGDASVFPKALCGQGNLEITDRAKTGVFAPPDVSKGAAIQEWIALCGMEEWTSVAIGNDTIDLSAFDACDVSAAVGNAHREALEAADVIIGRNDEDGAARYLLSLLKP